MPRTAPQSTDPDPVDPQGFAEAQEGAQTPPQPSDASLAEVFRREVVNLNEQVERLTSNRLWLQAMLLDRENEIAELRETLKSLDATPQD